MVWGSRGASCPGRPPGLPGSWDCQGRTGSGVKGGRRGVAQRSRSDLWGWRGERDKSWEAPCPGPSVRSARMGAMPDTMQPAPLPSLYQLRVVVRGVSPLIWRRLLLPADTTIAGLHAVLQIAFGLTGTHLRRFVVHGREYGIGYVGGVGFRGDPHLVRLADLGLRPTERFVYDYAFTDGWRLDLRLEQILVMDPGRVYPRCTGGRRAGPPEDCGGVHAFLENTQAHHVLAAAIRAAEILGMLLD